MHLLFLICISALLALRTPVWAAPPATNLSSSVFWRPVLEPASVQLLTEVEQALQKNDLAAAEKICQKLTTVAPDFNAGYYDLACVQARLGQADAAFVSLDAAIAKGFRDAAHLQEDPDLISLHGDARFAVVVEKARKNTPPVVARTVTPYVVQDGVALVGDSNTRRDAATNLLESFFKFAPTNSPVPEIIREHGEVGTQLREWFRAGTAAGNPGDFYDNRDSGHSALDCKPFPQLTRIQYAPEAIAAKVHYGLQELLFFNGVVLGNSSTALVGDQYWRSQTRLAYVNPRLVTILAAQYFRNHLYIYPEHRDHKPVTPDGKNFGDVFPANTPYLITSQGSSGSDQPFLNAVACTLAAFQPATKQFLVQNGALMPTVQMIFRFCNKPVTNAAAYLTGIAHPTVFEGGDVQPLEMIRLAHEIPSNNVPPLVQLRVVDEDLPVLRRDYFDVANREKLFDTPCAIARIWRSTQSQRHMTISAEASRDLNDKPLTWRWVVLRGDASAIKIEPRNAAGSVVELTVPYPTRQPIRPGHALESNRIDIGCFAYNGTYYSAPAFVTFFGLDNEIRKYDAAGKILSVTYTGATDKGNYVDPMLDLPKSWRDEYHYDAQGQLTGWTRFRGEVQEEFTPDGELIVHRATDGRVTAAARVKYVIQARKNQLPCLVQQTGEIELHH